jgi:GcrA cell cycle regulator
MFDWTDENVERLKSEALHGRSATEIATDFGGGCTRNAVIGKLHRLGLTGLRPAPARPSTEAAVAPPTQRQGDMQAGNLARKRQADAERDAKRSAERAARMEQMRKEGEAAQRRFEKIDGGKTLLELASRDCRWPHGEIGSDDFRYCGAATDGTGPYCAAHAALAYNAGARRLRMSNYA